MPFRTAPVLTAVAMMPLQAMAQLPAEAGATLELRQEALISHQRVTLSDVAVLHTRGAQSQAMGSIPLGRAPRIGQVERLSRAQIEQAIRRHHGVPVTPSWTGAASVALRTQAQMVSGQDIRQTALDAVRAQYRAEGTALAVELALPLSDYEVPIGVITIKVRPLPPAGERGGRMAVWVDLYVQGEMYRSVVVQLAVSLRRQAYVALHSIAPGATATAQDFVLRDADVDTSPGVAVNEPLLPFRAARVIRAGEPLTAAAMLSSGSFMRGDRVKLQVRSGLIGIEMAGVAMDDGQPGQLLRVRPTNGRDIVTGRVSQSGAVILD
jgi:flagella basal body P-ring formation protein FlgA